MKSPPTYLLSSLLLLLPFTLSYSPPLLPFLKSFYSTLSSSSTSSSSQRITLNVDEKRSIDPRNRIPDFLNAYNQLSPLLDTPEVEVTEDGYVVPEYTPEEYEVPGDDVNRLMSEWIQKTVCNLQLCPYTHTSTIAGENIKNVSPGTVHYRTSPLGPLGLSNFYKLCDDILSNNEVDYNSGILTFPNVPFTSFLQFTELCKFGLDFTGLETRIQLVYFHPKYTRDEVTPIDQLVYGHLPPTEWYPYMADVIGRGEVVEDLGMQDYQRRSPWPMINVLRGEQLARATGGNSVVDLEVGGGGVRKASGLSTYVRNGKRLDEIGRTKLDSIIRAHGGTDFSLTSSADEAASTTTTTTATATATSTAATSITTTAPTTTQQVWSEEYQRYYVYDPETNESRWE